MTIKVSTTIIVPCYNEGQRIGQLLADFSELLKAEPQVQVLVVDDGSAPEHLKAVEALVTAARAKMPRIKLHQKPRNGGKGSALAAGMERADTEIVGFVDADGSVTAAESLRVIEQLDDNLDGVIGSRVKMLGREVDRKLSRHLVGRVFATIVSVLFDIPVYDSQCGCKFFRRDRIVSLLPRIESQGWLWDTQLLILAYKARLRVVECPVSWREIPGSKVSMLVDPIKMFLQLVAFRKTLVT